MRRVVVGYVLGIITSISIASGAGDPVQRLLEAERAFAQLSVSAGMDTAFLANLADDGILLRPGPVNGRLWTRRNPAGPVRLSWEPKFADASVDGDLGYTTGPWTSTSLHDTTRPARYGHYVSVWRCEQGGTWKLVFDCGISHPLPWRTRLDGLMGGASASRPTGLPPGQSTLENCSDGLLETDQALARLCERGHAKEALTNAASPGGLFYRSGVPPIIGKDSVQSLLAGQSEAVTFSPLTAETSRSCDLGYTFGSLDRGGTKGYYLRIWRRQAGGMWNIVVNVETAGQ